MINQIGELNPQLFRELKGRLNKKNLLLTGSISLFGQLVIYLYFQALLPLDSALSQRNHYCLNDVGERWSTYPCVRDALGNWQINWSLWWLDLFTCLSVIGIVSILVVGSYLLIADLSKEETQGTLNFIRLTPQSVESILWGKIIGVPILLYCFSLLTLPLHLLAGIKAGIPFALILGFYAVLGASCILFYSASLLYGLVSSGLGNFQAWLGSGALLFFLFFISAGSLCSYYSWENPGDWLRMFYPGTALYYLVKATGLQSSVNYFDPSIVQDLRWYDLPLWQNNWLGITILLLNSCLWTFWMWQGIKRRFYNPNANLLSKNQSYWLSTTTIGMILGFAIQTEDDYDLFGNLTGVLFFELILFLGLIAALSPKRQVLQDWARYQHYLSQDNKRGIVNELIWQEKSPSIVVIAINLVITAVVMLPVIIILPLNEYKIPALWGLLLNSSMILLYASVAQLLLLIKQKRQGIWAATTVTTMILLPLGIIALFGISSYHYPQAWLFSPLPMVAVQSVATQVLFFATLGQWLMITLSNFTLTRYLQKTGESETKAILAD